MLEYLASPEIWMAFDTLATLEIVLGIDNIIFIGIICGHLPEHQRARARFLGLGLAMGLRILLLLSLSWIMGLTADLFTVFDNGISGRDLILLIGGAFLIAKATREVHNSLEVDENEHHGVRLAGGFGMILAQIGLIDLVFSLDSVITAVGLVDEVPVMIAAIVTAVLVMMVAVGPVSRFIEENPSIKMLALSFLILIGLALVAEGWDLHVPKGYIYVAMAFSFTVQLLNIAASRRRSLKLRKAQLGDLVLGGGDRRTARRAP